MISRLRGKLVAKEDLSILIDVQGVIYEVLVPGSVMARLEERIDSEGRLELVTYHYIQISPSSGVPVLIGFFSDVEREFFLQFIKVSGIGPRAAVKALNKPISEVTGAIDSGDLKFLTSLPGIGAQRAREIVAKLQGKVGRFGLIRDQHAVLEKQAAAYDEWQEEALGVLLQLQYSRKEAGDMIEAAMKRQAGISTTEELLNAIYNQNKGKS